MTKVIIGKEWMDNHVGCYPTSVSRRVGNINESVDN